MRGKERLNLTVRGEFKRKAAALANRRRRSISALFEDLIDEECSRNARADERPGDYGSKKRSSG
jgi:hypothetical protein